MIEVRSFEGGYEQLAEFVARTWREKADVVVSLGGPVDYVLALRECLRPLHLVSLPPGSCVTDSCSFLRILSPAAAPFAYRFDPSPTRGVVLASE